MVIGEDPLTWSFTSSQVFLEHVYQRQFMEKNIISDAYCTRFHLGLDEDKKKKHKEYLQPLKGPNIILSYYWILSDIEGWFRFLGCNHGV